MKGMEPVNRLVLCLIAVIASTGCAPSGPPHPAGASTSSPSTSVPASTAAATTTEATASSTPASTPTMEPVRQHIVCTDDITYEEHTYSSYRKAWREKYGKDACDSPTLKGSLSTRERKAVRIAFKSTDKDLKHLTRLYDLCAETGESAYFDEDFPDQPVEPEAVFRGMLYLCRDYPKRAGVERAIADVQRAKSGRLFTDGNYRVGKEVKPGRYYATDGDDCYWERNSRSGDIIANHLSSSRRNEVLIYPSDYSFSSENCGTWRQIR
jgi:hypothetical protein